MQDNMIINNAQKIAEKFILDDFDFQEFQCHYVNGDTPQEHCFSYSYAHALAEMTAQIICNDLTQIESLLFSYGTKIAHLNDCDFAYALECLKIQLLSKPCCTSGAPPQLKEDILLKIHTQINDVLYEKSFANKQIILNHIVYKGVEEVIQ